MFETLKKILIDKLGIEPDLIRPDAYLGKDLELDSTETVVIALELKKLLKINYEFPEDDLTLLELSKQIEEMSEEKE